MPLPIRPPRLPRTKPSVKAGSLSTAQRKKMKDTSKKYSDKVNRKKPKNLSVASKAMQILWFTEAALWLMLEAIRQWVEEVLLDPDYDVHNKFENSVVAYIQSGDAVRSDGRFQIPVDQLKFDMIPFDGDNFWHNWAGSIAAALTILTGQRGHNWSFVIYGTSFDFVHPESGLALFSLDFGPRGGVVVKTPLGKLTEKLAATAALDELIASVVGGITLADGIIYTKSLFVDSPIEQSRGLGDSGATSASGQNRAERGGPRTRATLLSDSDAGNVFRRIRDESDADGIIEIK